MRKPAPHERARRKGNLTCYGLVDPVEQKRGFPKGGWIPASLACLLVALALTSCAPATVSQPDGRSLTIAAAADLQFAFTEIGRIFEQRTGAKVTFTFGSSGNLAKQIESGAPVDLFASADEGYVRQLASRGAIVEGTEQLYAIGRIVLASHRSNGPPHARLEDLLKPQVKRVSIANPDHAPYGLAARQSLETVGLWEQLKPKLVYGENVRQALQFVQTGNAEAGIVALSIAEVPEVSYVLIDPTLHLPLRQSMAVVKGTLQQQLAREFAAFVGGPEGRSIMERYGFLLPGDARG